MPHLVRIVVQRCLDEDELQRSISRNVGDGIRHWNEGSSLTIVTVHRGGWLRALWRIWKLSREKEEISAEGKA